MILGIISSIAWLLQLLCILILGKRNGFLHEWILKYYAYLIKLQSYEGYLTDERNPIIPES
jgi:hypothetical protein